MRTPSQINVLLYTEYSHSKALDHLHNIEGNVQVTVSSSQEEFMKLIPLADVVIVEPVADTVELCDYTLADEVNIEGTPALLYLHSLTGINEHHTVLDSECTPNVLWNVMCLVVENYKYKLAPDRVSFAASVVQKCIPELKQLQADIKHDTSRVLRD